MKLLKSFVSVFALLFMLVACTLKGEPQATEEDRIEYLDSMEYIVKYRQDDIFEDTLIITMNDEFIDLKISEQYLFLADFFDTYKEKFEHLNKLFELVVFPPSESTYVYSMYKDELCITSTDDCYYRVELEGNEEILDKLDKEVVFNAFKKNEDSLLDTETYIDGKNGHDWIQLTENQKFHAVSNALYNLDNNGYIIEESEDYYIEALDVFYSDASTLDTPINEALASIGIMSGTIYK